jgi:phosphoribosylglycinamide formyltransferase-1
MKKIAVFASGTGSNAEKLIEHFSSKDKGAVVSLIVCNKPDAGVLYIAKREKVPALLIEKEKFFRGDGYVPELKKKGIDFIALAGFLWKIPQTLIDAYPRRIINIHPALLPKYGGKGMFGAFVHEAVIGAKEKESGITIHFVDEHYDHGDIIFQYKCRIDDSDDPDSLSKKIHELEHRYYPLVVEKVVREMSVEDK